MSYRLDCHDSCWPVPPMIGTFLIQARWSMKSPLHPDGNYCLVSLNRRRKWTWGEIRHDLAFDPIGAWKSALISLCRKWIICIIEISMIKSHGQNSLNLILLSQGDFCKDNNWNEIFYVFFTLRVFKIYCDVLVEFSCHCIRCHSAVLI